MWRARFYLRGLPYLLVSAICLAFHICCASAISNDPVLDGAGAPSPLAGDFPVYTTSNMPESIPSQQNVTLIFVAGVSICLAIFAISYCIAYRNIMVRQGETNQLFRSRVRGMILEEQNSYEAEEEEGHGGLDVSLVSSLRTVQYRSGRLKELEMMKAAGLPPLPLQEQNVIMWAKECAVCLSEYEEGEEMKVLPVCGHCFHKACINMWLSAHTTCPICRLSLLKLPAADPAIAAPSHTRSEPPRGLHLAVDI